MKKTISMLLLAGLLGCTRAEPHKDRVTADFDGDGIADTAELRQSGRSTELRVYYSAGGVQAWYFPFHKVVYGIDTEDIDGDGRPDLYVLWKSRDNQDGMFFNKLNLYHRDGRMREE